ncbi:MAG: hypothetical protein K9L68_13615 [Spirochaetales bacterium]|nr:hypothetical protein [Spirochaetales bacterium]
MGIQNTSVLKKQKAEDLPRGRNTLHQVFEHHFTDFCIRYDEEYADTFGKFRLERIQVVGEHFLTCGDYRQGIARIRCSNPDCGLVGAYGTCSTRLVKQGRPPPQVFA